MPDPSRPAADRIVANFVLEDAPETPIFSAAMRILLFPDAEIQFTSPLGVTTLYKVEKIRVSITELASVGGIRTFDPAEITVTVSPVEA